MATDVQNIIPKIDSPERVYDLFHSLGYPNDKLLDPSYKRKIDEFEFAKEEKEKVKGIYTVFNYDGKLQIFLIEVKSLSAPFVRYLAKRLSDRYLRFLLILTTDYKDYSFVLPEFEQIEEGKHKLKLTRLNFDRTRPYHTDLLTISNISLTGVEENWRDIWKKWKDAFSVEKVTTRFFADYKNAFFELRKTFEKQNIPIKQSHELSQQVLNRLMFLYFIVKKRWLNDDTKFIKWYWERYRDEKRKGSAENDSFYDKWIQVLFLQAFNNQYSHPSYLPKDVDKVLADAPYLNGGLFKRNDLDDLKFFISDSLFETVFSFFEKYNFTIREELPLDVEVAVDPQMIGYVYESLSNVAEEIYERQDLGIFYTPTVEVDFMCRRTVVEYLSKHLTELSRDWIYRLLFDEDKNAVAEHLSKQKLWYRLEEVLDNLAVVDPACGSGAFLMGMLHVLAELYKFIYTYIKREVTDFELKKKIIGNSLYGVDVMPWAVHSAELRLWLQLIIEEDIPYEQRKLFPLLPNLNMKLRIGDSLVQEVGGISLHVRDSKLSPALKRRLTSLKSEKEKYYNNDPTAKFKSGESLQQEEMRIFGEMLEDKIISLQINVQKLDGDYKSQMNMFGEGSKEEKQRSLFEKEIKAARQEIEHLRETKRKIQAPGQKPFVWDIDFAEIFGDKGGFDIVIGNPPYVRQEKIAPPNRLKAEVRLEDKREYKDKLLSSIQAHYPFIKKLDKKSDYYIYFYFHGLSLLNEKGVFCFITSNSWLDVGYGKDLQEFLLKYCHVKAIYDNEAKRSFEHADVNTVIALFGPPDVRKPGVWPALEETARFVMFKKPFEEAVNTKNLLAIEKADSIHKTESYRVYPVKQETLLEEGWEKPEEDNPLPAEESESIHPLPAGESKSLHPLPVGESKSLHPLPVGEGRGEGIFTPFKKPPLPDHLLKACRDLRKDSTDAEQLLWNILRDRRLDGIKFRRQHPIGKFILDFYCHEFRLAIELDGGGHNELQQRQYDEQRTKALEGEGIRVLRFWNHEVLQKTEAVIDVIWNALQQTPHPNPLPEGEGTKQDNVQPKCERTSRISSPLPVGESESLHPLPVGESESLHPLTAGESKSLHPLPVGESKSIHPLPVGESESIHPLPAGESKSLHPLPVGEGRGEGIKKERKKSASLLQEKFIIGKYEGNKWGGKYLRAPDIFFTILEKGKGKLVRLGEVAEVRFGIKTGADNFFYLKKTKAANIGIEKEFIHTILVSSDQMKGFVTKETDTDIVLITTDRSPKELKGTIMLDYIEIGETKAFPGRSGESIPAERPSCKGHRPYWYSVNIPSIPTIYWMEMRRERYFTLLNNGKLPADHTFYSIYPQSHVNSISLCGLLNTTFIPLLVEVFANDPGGGGTSLQTPIREIKRYVLLPRDLLNSNYVKKAFLEMSKRQCFSIIQELGINPALPIREQKPNPLPDRKALDDIIFDILGLTEDERREVYWAVCELVKNRLEKARSV